MQHSTTSQVNIVSMLSYWRNSLADAALKASVDAAISAIGQGFGSTYTLTF